VDEIARLPRSDQERLLLGEISRLRLTPGDLEGKPYRLSPWLVLYILLGVGLLGGMGVALPVSFLLDGKNPFLVLLGTLFLWFFMLRVPFANTREAICEHITRSWLKKRGVNTLEWLRRRQELTPKMPRVIRYAADYMPEGHRPQDPPARTRADLPDMARR
jgi:hypothetical protein